MSASDIPETFRTSRRMARALAGYMADPYAVRRAVLENFRGAPSVPEIRQMRADHLARRNAAPEPAVIVKPYNASVASDALAGVNELFLSRLRDERARSLLEEA